MTSPVRHISVDCREPYALAQFWVALTGGHLAPDDGPGDPEVLLTCPGGTPLLFLQVPEAKAGKNRLHLDISPRLPRDEEVQRLLALGAAVLDDRTHPDGTGWVVMTDPEGNEFCVERSAAERGRPAVDHGERAMPPIHASGEREMLTGMLDWYREGVVAKVAGMTQADAVQSPLRSGTTAAGLVKHLALVEDSWFTHGLAQQPEPEPWASAPFEDDEDWEFHSADVEPLADSVALYLRACDRSRASAAGHGLDDTSVNKRGRVFSLRFVLLHLIEETARHLGHLDALRELADGHTGE